MFCPNCGTQFENETATCPNCGTVATQPLPQEEPAAPVEAAPVDVAPEMQQPVEEQPGVQQFVTDKVQAVAKKLNLDTKTTGLIGIAVAALIVILVLVIALSGGGDIKQPLELSQKIMLKQKSKKIKDFYPKAYWDYMEEENDQKASEVIEEFEDEFKDEFDSLDKAFAKAYGDNYKIKYKITDKEEPSTKTMENIEDGLKSNYDIPKKKIKKYLELDIELTIKGKEDDDTVEMEVYAVKIGGDWYYTSANGVFKDPSLILQPFMVSEKVMESLMEDALS